MAAAKRGRAEAIILLGIAFIADADMAEIEQAHDRGDDRVAVELAAGHILLDPRSE